MTAILYLLRRQIVNWFKQLRYNKSKLFTLIFWLGFMLLIFGTTFFGSSLPDSDEMDGSAEFMGGFMVVLWTALMAFMVTVTMFQGTKKGSSTYKSADIHFIFTGPVPSQTVLVYGMLNSLSSVFISTFFMIYQLPNMRNMGLTWSNFIMLFISWFIIVAVSQLATMALYLLLFGRPKMQAIVKLVIVALPILLIVLYAYILLRSGTPSVEQLLPSLVGMLRSPLLLLIPFLGWATSFMMTAFIGMHTWAYVGLGLLLLSAVLMIIYISRSEADFYEDAMGLTQEREALLAKQKSGNIRKIKKVRKTGLNHGWGMDAIYYRQMREYRRTSPLLVTPAAFFYTMAGGFIAFFMWSMATDGEMLPGSLQTYGPMVLFTVALFIMFWHGMFISLLVELESPLFYIAPGEPIPKLLQASRTGLTKILVDLAPALLIVLLVFRLNPFVWLSLILALLSVHLLISGSQLVVYRLMGSAKGTLETMVLLLIQGVAMGPTLVLTIVTFVLLSMNLFSFVWLTLFLIAVINVVLYFACLPPGVNILRNGLER